MSVRPYRHGIAQPRDLPPASQALPLCTHRPNIPGAPGGVWDDPIAVGRAASLTFGSGLPPVIAGTRPSPEGFGRRRARLHPRVPLSGWSNSSGTPSARGGEPRDPEAPAKNSAKAAPAGPLQRRIGEGAGELVFRACAPGRIRTCRAANCSKALTSVMWLLPTLFILTPRDSK